MALTTPVIYPIPAFDINESCEIRFNVPPGGNQVIGHKITIKNNATSEVVYENTVQSFQHRHALLPGSLPKNGIQYNITVQTYGENDEYSIESPQLQFWCYTAPTVKAQNISSDSIVRESNYRFEFTYEQKENELINSFKGTLYDAAKNVVDESELIYGSNTLSYDVGGLTDNTQYYVEAIASTIEGTQVTSGLIKFTVDYIKPNFYGIITLENADGYIKIASNIVSVEGVPNPDPPVYIDDNAIDLTTTNSWVKFLEGFLIQNDFSGRIRGRGFKPYKSFLEMEAKASTPDYPHKLILNAMQGDFNGTQRFYIELWLYSGIDNPYFIMSNLIDVPDPETWLEIYIRKSNGLCDLLIREV